MTRTVGATLLVFFALAGTARADGLPVGNVDAGPGGVAGADVRFVTLPSGKGTMVMVVARNGGQVRRWARIRGHYTVPAVALDASAGGLSADGSTLALIEPRPAFPRSRTRLVLLETQLLHVRQRITLRGDFSFDAVSPDGAQLYLINYTSRDPTRYDVRAFDTRTGRLAPGKIVDPNEPGEEMRGYPVTRASSPDGRWAYTLYDGAGKHPFVHALDTREVAARCIDLDALAGRRDLMALRLGVAKDGAELRVVRRGQTLAAVDTRTFAVRWPAAGKGDGGGVAWVLWPGVLAAAVGAGAVSLLVRRRRRIAAA